MKQNIVSKIINEEGRVKRESHGRTIAISRSVYRLARTDVYYVQSSTVPSRYYYVRFQYEPNLQNSSDNSGYSCDNSSWCSCMDYHSNRSEKCKHLYAVEYSIRLGTLQDTDDKLPISQGKKNESNNNFSYKIANIQQDPINTRSKKVSDIYKDYSIATLNELEKAEIEAEQYSSRTQRQSYDSDIYDF